MNKQHASLLFRVALSAVLVVLLFSLIDRQSFFEQLRTLDPIYFFLGLGFYFLATAFWALRWYLFVRAAGEDESFGKVFRTLVIGIFFSMFLPTIVGTDLGRMYEMSRDRSNKIGVVSTVLLDRLMGLVTLTLMALVALLFGIEFTGNVPIREIVVGTTAMMIAGWLVFFNRNLMRSFTWVFELPILSQLESSIRSLYETLLQLQSQPRLLVATLIVSVLNQVSEVFSVIMIAHALRLQIETIHFFIFMPLIWLITMIPVSISGLGLREGVFAFFFARVGVTGAQAIAMSLVFYGYSVVIGVIGGLTIFGSSVKNIFNLSAPKVENDARVDV